MAKQVLRREPKKPASKKIVGNKQDRVLAKIRINEIVTERFPYL